MAAFHLSVIPWGKRTDDFMTDPVHFQIFLEMHGLLPINSKAVGKFDSIIGLNAFDRTREGFHQLFYKPGRRIGAMLLECLHETPAGVLVNSCILKKLFSDHLGVFQTGRRDRFHIDPNPLSGMIHLFIGLRDVLRDVYKRQKENTLTLSYSNIFSIANRCRSILLFTTSTPY